MASEGTIWAGIRFASGNAGDEYPFPAVSFNMTGKKSHRFRITVNTTGENIPLGDITDPGLIIVVNRSTSNNALLSLTSGGTFVPKIRPGLPAVFEINGAALYAKSDSGEVELEGLVLQL